MVDSGQKIHAMGSGTPVLLVLHTPREKCWGVLDEITAAGVFLRGLDLNAFDDWVSAVVHGTLHGRRFSVLSNVASRTHCTG